MTFLHHRPVRIVLLLLLIGSIATISFATHKSTKTTAGTTLPNSLDGFSGSCGNTFPTRYIGAAAYTPSGSPTLAYLSYVFTPNPSSPLGGSGTYASVNLGQWTPTSPANTQLIACESQIDHESSVAKTCSYQGNLDLARKGGGLDGTYSVSMYRGIYEIKVYETASGKEVGTAAIGAGTTLQCPTTVTETNAHTEDLYSTPSPNQQIAAVKSILNAK